VEFDYSIEPLAEHGRTTFSCGTPELDSYFRERASRDARNKIGAVFVLLPKTDPSRVAGCYTLSNQEIDIQDLPPELTKRIGKYRRIPATLIGRLAVDRDFQGKGLGEILLIDAMRRSLLASRSVASFAVLVDSKNEDAARFYQKYGFLPLVGKRMFLPMKTAEAL